MTSCICGHSPENWESFIHSLSMLQYQALYHTGARKVEKHPGPALPALQKLSAGKSREGVGRVKILKSDLIYFPAFEQHHRQPAEAGTFESRGLLHAAQLLAPFLLPDFLPPLLDHHLNHP